MWSTEDVRRAILEVLCRRPAAPLHLVELTGFEWNVLYEVLRELHREKMVFIRAEPLWSRWRPHKIARPVYRLTAKGMEECVKLGLTPPPDREYFKPLERE